MYVNISHTITILASSGYLEKVVTVYHHHFGGV